MKKIFIWSRGGGLRLYKGGTKWGRGGLKLHKLLYAVNYLKEYYLCNKEKDIIKKKKKDDFLILCLKKILFFTFK